MASRRILVTGAAGFFGSRFVRRFATTDEILATDVGDLDITDAAAVGATVSAFRPDLVVHAAAVAATAFCDAHPDVARRINVDGAVALARAAEAVGAGFVLISSEQVFNGNPEPGPHAESDPAVPDTVYGATKLAAEAELAAIVEKLWVLRFTWLFGLPERGCGMSPGVPWNIAQALLAGRRLAERTDEFRGITYVHDLLDRFDAILDCPPSTYHVGSANDLSRFELAKVTLDAFGVGARAEEVLTPVTGAKRRDVRLSHEKLARAGVTFPPSAEAIARCVAEFRFTA